MNIIKQGIKIFVIKWKLHINVKIIRNFRGGRYFKLEGQRIFAHKNRNFTAFPPIATLC